MVPPLRTFIVAAFILSMGMYYVPSSPAAKPRIEFFLKSLLMSNALVGLERSDLTGVRHYRVLPGRFPEGMKYHFDGLATVMKLEFLAGGKLNISVKPFESAAERGYATCDFFGSGTGPTNVLIPHVCFQNPGVNLLPFKDQLWLTIDTNAWGLMDPTTLETLPNKVVTSGQTLNAHPACDQKTKECFVQHPCTISPVGRQVCFSRLESVDNGNLKTEPFATATLKEQAVLQHSHSPCLTQNYLVSKLDRFVWRNPAGNNHRGLLRLMHQGESNEWMITSRPHVSDAANVTRIARSNVSFVNNHFVNCYETETGDVVVDTMATTSAYLDSYFDTTLSQPPNWTEIFKQAMRCTVPVHSGDISCQPLLPNDENLFFDYPTFNPKWKMSPESRYFYAIAGDANSLWFDRVIKVDSHRRKIVSVWQSPGTYVTEASFIPNADSEKSEDSGVLLTISYKQGDSTSHVTLLDPKDLTLKESVAVGEIVPFHAHGVSCVDGQCYSNP